MSERGLQDELKRLSALPLEWHAPDAPALEAGQIVTLNGRRMRVVASSREDVPPYTTTTTLEPVPEPG